MVMDVLNYLDDVLYYPILMVILVAAGLVFSWKTRLIQLRMFAESIRVVMEKPTKDGNVSSFQALMVSTASRVGTGNIIGVSTAICLGGPGSVHRKHTGSGLQTPQRLRKQLRRSGLLH